MGSIRQRKEPCKGQKSQSALGPYVIICSLVALGYQINGVNEMGMKRELIESNYRTEVKRAYAAYFADRKMYDDAKWQALCVQRRDHAVIEARITRDAGIAQLIEDTTGKAWFEVDHTPISVDDYEF